MLLRLLALLTLFSPALVSAQECVAPSTCLTADELDVFRKLLVEKQCLQQNLPKVTSTAIEIITDKDGRVFSNGTGDKPFEVSLDWCNYQLSAKTQIKVVAAQAVAPEWGFRFRPKAAVGLLTADLLAGHPFKDTVDGGVLLEPFFWRFLNLNGYVGVRSVGAGLGADLTSNFGFAVTANITYEGRFNPLVTTYFAF